MAAPFDTTYKPPRQCGDSDGGHMAVAILKGTDDVYSSFSTDGVTWSTPVSVGTITTGAKSVTVYQESAAHSTRFVVTNASGFMKYSDAFGAAGSWSDY